MLFKFIVKFGLFISLLASVAGTALAQDGRHLVLGVISSEMQGEGVALVKDTHTQKTTAVRIGQKLADGSVVKNIFRRFVELQIGGRVVRVAVGSGSVAESVPFAVASKQGGIEVKGNKVRISESYRRHILTNELGKVLMQAAAVPQYVEGRIKGFMLTDIDPGSVYELAGLKNGDVVLEINSQELTDVGATVRMLHTLKEEPDAAVKILRAGQEMTLEVEIN